MKRSPAAALWLSLLPGAGHVYIGQPVKGAVIVLLFASLIQMMDHGADGFGIVIPFIFLYAMLDAYRTAVELNHAIDTGRARVTAPSKALPKWWGGLLIVLGLLFLVENNGWVDLDFLWDFWPLGLVAAGVYILTRKPVEPQDELAPPPPPPESGPSNDPAGASSFEGDAENA